MQNFSDHFFREFLFILENALKSISVCNNLISMKMHQLECETSAKIRLKRVSANYSMFKHLNFSTKREKYTTAMKVAFWIPCFLCHAQIRVSLSLSLSLYGDLTLPSQNVMYVLVFVFLAVFRITRIADKFQNRSICMHENHKLGYEFSSFSHLLFTLFFSISFIRMRVVCARALQCQMDAIIF